MKRKLFLLCLFLIISCLFTGAASAQKRKTTGKPAGSSTAAVDKADKDELDALLDLAPAERIEKLKAFIAAHPRSTLKMRAQELIVSARAALGDEKLKAGDAAGGIEQFRLALAEAPQGMSDKLFVEVLAQIPSNLFLRGERAASLEIAHAIEERFKDDAKHLLVMAAFYLGIEAADDALRVSDAAIKLAPEMSAAYQARGAAHRIALQLEESAADYARALELDPKSDGARKSLADLSRATGKTEAALALYRERLQVEPADEFARTGMVISLFELGRKEEAERELAAAMKDLPNSLTLLTGMAYWFAAHNESARAVELAQQAVNMEPRYTWGPIALARGLLAERRPLDAERALLVARQYGRFPTLDYELASALAAAGFYGEAAAALSSFTIKDDQIETYLAGRTHARAQTFTELLAPERRASIFQFSAADNEQSARTLKALLAFTLALNPAGGREAIKEADVLAAAREFIGADDDMRAFRRLYVASRLLQARVALPDVLEQTDAVTGEVEKALAVPTATVSVMADELFDARREANRNGSTLRLPDAPRSTLSNIMRGRIEDLAGWSLFNQQKYAEATVRLRRAISVLPENSIWWRNAMWHLGASLDAGGKSQDALDVYYKSYKAGGQDMTRRAVIEALYRKLNGSLDGLDAKIGASPFIASNPTTPADAPPATQGVSAESNEATRTETGKPEESKPEQAKPVEAQPGSDATTEPKTDAPKTDAPKTDAPKTDEPKPDEPKPEAPKVETPNTDAPKTDTLKPETVNSPAPSTAAGQNPAPVQTPSPVETRPVEPAAKDEQPAAQPQAPPATNTAPTPQTSPGEARRERRVGEGCAILLSEESLTIDSSTGSTTITVTLDGLSSADGINAVSNDWSDIAIFPEPKKDGASSNTRTFSVTSMSKKTGTFTITFKTPCGTKDVTVTVK